MANEDLLLDTKETGQRLHVPVATLRWWRHKGLGPKSFRMGQRKVMYRLADVEAWLEAQYNADVVA